jgi:hypothetical protein
MKKVASLKGLLKQLLISIEEPKDCFNTPKLISLLFRLNVATVKVLLVIRVHVTAVYKLYIRRVFVQRCCCRFAFMKNVFRPQQDYRD